MKMISVCCEVHSPPGRGQPGEAGSQGSLESSHDTAPTAPSAPGSPRPLTPKCHPGKAKALGFSKQTGGKGWERAHCLIQHLPPPQAEPQFICRGHHQSHESHSASALGFSAPWRGRNRRQTAPPSPCTPKCHSWRAHRATVQPLRFWGPVVVLDTLTKCLLSSL